MSGVLSALRLQSLPAVRGTSDKKSVPSTVIPRMFLLGKGAVAKRSDAPKKVVDSSDRDQYSSIDFHLDL